MNRTRTRVWGVIWLIVGLPTWTSAQSTSQLDQTVQTYTRQTIVDWLQSHNNTQPTFKPGDTLGVDALDQIRPFLPPGFFEQFVFEGVQFRITEPGDYSPLQHAAYATATEKYCGQTQFTANGQLSNYVAGSPVCPSALDTLDTSDPLAGIKISWVHNYRWQHYGQNAFSIAALLRQGGPYTPHSLLPKELFSSSPDVQVDKVIDLNLHRLYLSNLPTEEGYRFPLTDTDTGQPTEYLDRMVYFEPYDLRGIDLYIKRFLPAGELDQMFSYLPTTRKVRRLSAKERTDSWLGSEFTLDDFWMSSGRVEFYTWELLGVHPVLAVANSEHYYTHFTGPYGYVPDDRWELRPHWVVELKPGPQFDYHPYSSKILFIDTQFHSGSIGLAFDPNGKLLRVFHTQHAWSEDSPREAETNHGVFVADFRSISSINVQAAQKPATLIVVKDGGYPQVTPEEYKDKFDLNELSQGRR